MAAASLGRALEAAIDELGQPATMSFGASGTIARQIEYGAPADLFISANPRWMRHLVELGLIAPEDVQPLISNELVLIIPASAPAQADETLSERLAGESFVMSDPEFAPVGQYGKAALENLGLWEQIAPHFVPTRNSVASVASVAKGEAALGLVYASDAAGVKDVMVLQTLPAQSHPPVEYLIAPVAQGEAPDAGSDLAAALRGGPAQAVFAAYGFVPLEQMP
ncbi:MAG: molybdate ABC transporter substrate-binding protein [Mangrovicoccus sp.]|nr:molybdate ABC transporter substrate-binding protein [Mangrovicoccus sp.]